MEPREAHRRRKGERLQDRIEEQLDSWRVSRHCHVSSGHSSRRKCRLYYRLVSVHVPLLVFDPHHCWGHLRRRRHATTSVDPNDVGRQLPPHR